MTAGVCRNIRAHGDSQGGFYPLGHTCPCPSVPVFSPALLSLRNAALASRTSGAVFVLKIKPRAWEAFPLPAVKLFAQELQCGNGGWGVRPVFAI